MERASRLFGKLTAGGSLIDVDDLARAAWPLAVGKKVAERTRPARMVRTRLIVEVEDLVWKKQLFTLSRQILTNLERHLGPGFVEDLEFRVMPARREPRRAEAAQPGATVARGVLDDADQIADPVMRNMYKLARKKALA
jgi:predicted nucleic acid-binding Zn ribbon protein